MPGGGSRDGSEVRRACGLSGGERALAEIGVQMEGSEGSQYLGTCDCFGIDSVRLAASRCLPAAEWRLGASDVHCIGHMPLRASSSFIRKGILATGSK